MAISEEKRKLRKAYKAFLNAEEGVDKGMINESIDNYLIPEVDYNGKVCLDLGGNVGGFTKIAVDGGATRVITVECDRRNFGKLSNSFKDTPNVEIIHAAVSDSAEKTIKLYKSDSNNNHCSTSIIQKTGLFKDYDEVDNVNIKYLLDKYRPDIIKVDIEGAEYGILDELIGYSPEFMFLELHVGKTKIYLDSALEKLKNNFPKHDIKPLIYFQKIGGYDCWFKK